MRPRPAERNANGLEKRRDVYLGQEADGLITGAKCRQLVAEVDAKIADIGPPSQGRSGDVSRGPPTWDEPIDVAAMNKHSAPSVAPGSA